MYKAKKQIITTGRVIAKGEQLESKPDTDRLFDLGYLEKTKPKKTKKKPTTHED